MKRIFENAAGFSLIEVLIAAGIMSIVAVGYGRMIVSHAEQQRGLTQKFEMLDLKNTMLQTYASPTACSCMLNSLSNTKNLFPLSFDSTVTSPSIKLSAIYGGCDATLAPTQVLATAGELLPGTGSQLKVLDISLVDIKPTGSANPNEYQGTFQIMFDPTTLMGSRRPVTLQQRFMVDGSSLPNAKTVSYCGTPGVTSFGGMFSKSMSNDCVEANPITTACSCPLGYTAQQVASGLTGTEASIFYCIQ